MKLLLQVSTCYSYHAMAGGLTGPLLKAHAALTEAPAVIHSNGDGYAIATVPWQLDWPITRQELPKDILLLSRSGTELL